jgi:TonB family protein
VIRRLALSVLMLCSVSAASAQDVGLIFENSSRAHFRRTSDDVELRSGPGWLRLPRLLQDFDLALEYKLKTGESDGRIIFNLWPTVADAQRLDFWLASATLVGPEALASPAAPPTTTTADRVVAAVSSGDTWRSLVVRRRGRILEISADGKVAAAKQVDESPMTVLFGTSAGAVGFRSMRLTTPTAGARGSAAGLWTSFARPGDGTQTPEVVHEQKPQYTAEAMRARVEGLVEVEAIVLTDGSVGDVRIIRSLNAGLDRNAVLAVHHWKFRPATVNGQAVPVIVAIELTFCLRAC